MLTDRDACMGAYTQGKRLDQIGVGTVMAKSVVTCRADDPVAHAEHLMQTHQIRRIPVVDHDGRPIGVLSLNDLARDCSRPGVGQGNMLLGFARTLAAICRPRAAKPAPHVPTGWEDYLPKSAGAGTA
jgi:CBS-domain-containing membrane protein